MLSAIDKPSLIINESKCHTNIERMLSKARSSNVIFRPHFKTHQSLHIGRWFKDHGIDNITVSSLSMAEKFAADGWTDITIAFPANIRELKKYNRLAQSIQLNLLVDSKEVIPGLDQGLSNHAGVFLEIDLGYKRSGISHTNLNEIDACMEVCRQAENLTFKGFLTHSGNTYHARSKKGIMEIHDHACAELNKLKERYSGIYNNIIISIGDTPSCSILEGFDRVDEIRPGNFVFYDLMQYYLGSCRLEDIAVSVACPVCGVYPDRKEILIYGGAVHLSKEFMQEPAPAYGMAVIYTEDGWTKPIEGTRLHSLSQEHGIIQTTVEFIEQVKHGDLLGILPVHSCLTADLLKDDFLII